MPDYNMSEREAAATMRLGKKVERDTSNITTGEELFSISGGNCQINLIVGEVTIQIETKTVNCKLVLDSDTGSDTDMCANLDLSGDEVGSLYTLEGTVATAMQTGQSGSCIGPEVPIIVTPGGIDATIGATHTGSIKWTLWYTPLEIGAYIEAS